MFRWCLSQKTHYGCSLVQYPSLFSLFKPQPCFNRCLLHYLPQKKCWCRVIKAERWARVQCCTKSPRGSKANTNKQLTHRSRMIHVLNYLQKWMPLHQTPRTRDDALVSCTLPSEARAGGAKFTGWHQHQRCRHTGALKHQGLMRTCQSECSCWPGSPALLCRQAAHNSINWPVPLAAEHRSWTALRKPAKSTINLAGP